MKGNVKSSPLCTLGVNKQKVWNGYGGMADEHVLTLPRKILSEDIGIWNKMVTCLHYTYYVQIRYIKTVNDSIMLTACPNKVFLFVNWPQRAEKEQIRGKLLQL